MYAVIDIGSNTVRLSVYSISGKELKPMFSRKSMAGLISYINDNGYLNEKGIRKAISILEGFKKIIENIKLDFKHVFVIATASFRNIKNGREVVDSIWAETGFEITVISGEQEGIYGFLGASHQMNMDSGLLVDIGGGSTEFVFSKNQNILQSTSLPMGSLNLYRNYVGQLIPTKEEIKKMKKFIKKSFEQIDCNTIDHSASLLFGVGGTTRATCKLINDLFDLPLTNRVILPAQLKVLLHYFYGEPEGVRKILQIVPDRIHTIIPGIILLREIVKHYRCEQINVSEYGVREGFLIQSVMGCKDGDE